MTREQIESKLLDYLLNELPSTERAEIDAALAKDAGLKATLAELAQSVGAITAAREAGGGERLSAERREALMAAAVRPTMARPVGWSWLSRACAAATILMFGGAGGWMVNETLNEKALRGGTVGQMANGKAADSPKYQYAQEPVKTSLVGPATQPANPATGTAVLPRDSAPAGDPRILHLQGDLKKKLHVLERAGVLEKNRRIGGGLRQMVDAVGPAEHGQNSEEYDLIVDNPFLRALADPLSTFSIDVDTAAYANMRRFVTSGQMPPADAIRIEELVNYFHYEYAAPKGDAPFSVNLEVHPTPWEPKHRLVRIGLQGREIATDSAPPANLVFLIDVSGSMNPEDRLPLVKRSLEMLVETLREQDKVSIVVYAGAAGLALPPTSGVEKAQILASLNNLHAGGSTNGGQGIELAYKTAQDHFVKDGVNRVILCTDGDFNVGVSDQGGLVRLIEEKRKTGVFLSVLGFGTGNYADARMQQLADKGNGNAAYIDGLAEAKKVLVEQATGTLITIAKDVKIQVEFNPNKVAAYRLIGYENRVMASQDFNDDKKDAGEIGAGHQVTALYEIIPVGVDAPASDVDELRYQQPKAALPGVNNDELCTVKLRYKKPDGDASTKIEQPFADPGVVDSTTEFDFAASVAAFGMLLRNSEYRGQANWDLVVELARGGLGNDKQGWRKQFVELAEKTREMAKLQK